MIISRKAGLVSAAFYATWMATINLDRSVWSLGLVPATVNIMMFMAAKAWTTRSRSWFVALGVLLGFSISLHLQMLVTIGLVLLLSWLKVRRFIVWTLLPILASFLPLLMFDLTHNFQTLSAVPKTIISLVDGSRPYTTRYFLYQFYPWAVVAASIVLTRIPRSIAGTILVVFVLVQLQSFVTYDVHPNFAERRTLADNVLAYWTPEDGLTIFINDRSYFEYGYLLLYYGRDRGVRANNVTKLEHPKPTQQLIEKVRAKAKEVRSKDAAFIEIKSGESLLLLDEDRLKLLPSDAFKLDITDTRKTSEKQ